MTCFLRDLTSRLSTAFDGKAVSTTPLPISEQRCAELFWPGAGFVTEIQRSWLIFYCILKSIKTTFIYSHLNLQFIQ